MGYAVPQMPLSMNIWTNGVFPGPPRLLAVPCQLRSGATKASGQDSTNNGWPFNVSALCSITTDIRDAYCPSGRDRVELPAGSGRYYDVCFVDDVAKGFPNAYRLASLVKVSPWPQPIP